MESGRGSILSKSYMKFFLVAIIIMGAGIVLITVRSLFMTFADPQSPEESEFFIYFINTLSSLSMLFIQLGFVMFCFSSFWGAMADGTLSDSIRRGMVFTTSITIIALALLMIFGNIIIY
ncbi:MAG: hypothetical protein ACFE8B_00125 [Candidatus Hermodarchaeota archaeon]